MESFFVSWTNTYYGIITGKELTETPELSKMKEASLKELQYSDTLLNHNLIKDWSK